MTDRGIIYGDTVAKALSLLDQADGALVRVPVSFDGRFVVLGVMPQAIRTAIAAYELTDLLPTKYDMNTRVIEIGSVEAIAESSRDRGRLVPHHGSGP